MKGLTQFTAISLLCLSTLPALAQPGFPSQQTQNDLDKLVKYFATMGNYLGVNLDNQTSQKPPFSQNNGLICLGGMQNYQTTSQNAFFGSIPIPTSLSSGAAGGTSTGASNANNSSNAFQFIPATQSSTQPAVCTGSISPDPTTINSQANSTFLNYTKNGINQAVDQPTAQNDPISQALLNVLGTPDGSLSGNCTDSNGVATSTFLTQNQIVANVIGSVPGMCTMVTSSYNQLLLPQLNAESLLAPLYLDATSNNSTSSSQQTNTAAATSRLTAANQAQQAMNFIRYVSGSVLPTILPNASTYSTYASSPSKLAAVNSYLVSLRIYAAQSSVGFSNLYYILSKRLPINGSTTTQALNEYNMATWRLADSNQWVSKVNTASSLTVQKEIVMLLAEINYQLYLDRQIQERMLLTSSVSLLQGTKTAQPNPDLQSQQTAADTNK
jgi:intracellular multiplication protein IcmX